MWYAQPLPRFLLEYERRSLFDATDYAYPAWWRGHDQTCAIFCRLVNDILDGKDVGRGVSNEPWEQVRCRLLELKR